jgi:hypothetical protein
VGRSSPSTETTWILQTHTRVSVLSSVLWNLTTKKERRITMKQTILLVLMSWPGIYKDREEYEQLSSEEVIELPQASPIPRVGEHLILGGRWHKVFDVTYEYFLSEQRCEVKITARRI